ncbi:aminoglycoside 6-adenylyltransferase [Paenibacillus sp. NPDC056579]|uniref:aminoglycoside 6-adenylyltransferase n=1 Tax=unclassified Paenibacillus TaxID=185978 RepID=UPI001EF81212|nr:aminoglycoside 6-adenylyltransferase [Paenibacillus sp. H1-7]ULL13590.1 aminoglycoside adenylyltransferase [Paenibacillus sp. H1-7]
MRSEQQVLDQMLEMAERDDNIRAVVLNGSRVNPNAPKDFMRDYDVVFYMARLKEASYNTDRSWIDSLGERVVVQFEYLEDGSYIYMMQFKDSVRIDLIFQDTAALVREVTNDSLSRVLLDKDNLNLELPEPNDSSYVVKRPTEDKWNLYVVELWWLQVYIAKELWRDEMPRVRQLYDYYFMESLTFLLEWHVGAANDWTVNVGSTGKWFKRFLEPEHYEELLSLYCGADPEEQWEKLFQAGRFIRKIGIPLAEKLGYSYPMEEDRNVTAYIEKVRRLPADAQSWEG